MVSLASVHTRKPKVKIDNGKRNRAQRRCGAKCLTSRAMRRNLHGRGRWRRGTTVTTSRYAFPFANSLDDK